MISALFSTLQEIVDSFGTLLSNLFSEVIGLIYVPGESGAVGSFTDFGTIVLVALGSGLLMWGLSFVLKYIRIGRAR